MNPRAPTAAVFLALALALLAGCAGPSPAVTATAPPPVPTAAPPAPTVLPPGPMAAEAAQSGMPSGPGAQWRLVVLSESQGWGLGQAYARQIQKDVGVKVILDNYALNSLTAVQVLQVLRTGTPPRPDLAGLPSALAAADVVVMAASHTDSVDAATGERTQSCFDNAAPTPCSARAFGAFTADLREIWAKITELRAGKPTMLRALDWYNPWVSTWKEQKVFEAKSLCFQCLSASFRQAAEAFGIPFACRYDAINGPRHDKDAEEQGYIGGDHIHPNEAGSQLSAELLAGLGYKATVVTPR